jgi:group I intron endonuclease
MNNNNLNIIFLKSYKDTYLNKFLIYKENRGKSGIYYWYNKTNNKSYAGSSINLSRRFYSYHSLNFLNKATLLGSSLIYNLLLKYGHSKFSLYILEYCKSNVLISREQYYINNLKPYYNIKNIY